MKGELLYLWTLLAQTTQIIVAMRFPWAVNNVHNISAGKKAPHAARNVLPSQTNKEIIGGTIGPLRMFDCKMAGRADFSF